MKLLVTCFFILSVLLISCSNSSKKDKYDEESLKIDGWDVKLERGITDTLNVKNWIPQSELSLQFFKKSDSSCLTPSLEFYPIELEDYIEKKLMNYLILRSSLFPPTPNTYTNDKYFVIGWNLIDYFNFKCCDCVELESQLIQRLNLKEKNLPGYNL